MNRFLRSIMLIGGFCIATGYSHNLDSVSMVTVADSVLTVLKTTNDTSITDSVKTLINTMSVSGTSDSAAVLLPIKLGTFTTKIVVVSFTKMNSCSISVKVNPLVSASVPALKDTIIKVCALSGIGVPGNNRQIHTGRSGVSVRLSGKQLIMKGLVLDMADRLVVRVVDQQGRAVRTYTAAGIATPSWRTDLRQGSFVAVISLNGKKIAANRIDWLK